MAGGGFGGEFGGWRGDGGVSASGSVSVSVDVWRKVGGERVKNKKVESGK